MADLEVGEQLRWKDRDLHTVLADLGQKVFLQIHLFLDKLKVIKIMRLLHDIFDGDLHKHVQLLESTLYDYDYKQLSQPQIRSFMGLRDLLHRPRRVVRI